jgi:hypothetical protein
LSPALALLGIAAVVAAAMWLTLHAVPMSSLDVLPARCRRRITWWQLNARWVYACCVVLAVAGGLTRLST